MSTSPPPTPRGFIQSTLDRIFGYQLSFPTESTTYTTTPQCIPVQDATLAADLFRPQGPSPPHSTILIITPYGRTFPLSLLARLYAARNYQVLLASCRGTFSSTGAFDAMRTERDDGAAIVTWMRAQEWYTGSFAMIGASYMGFAQWAVLSANPRDMLCAVPVVAPHDFARSSWRAGALDLDIVRWAGSVAVQEKYSFFRRAVLRSGDVEPVLKTVPLNKNVRQFLGDGSPWLDGILARPDVADEYYAAMKTYDALEVAEIPILIVTGWHDLFNEQSMEQYLRLRERGVDVALTVGPWTHLQSGFEEKLNLGGFQWIEQHVAGKATRRAARVEYFVTGSKVWKTLETYPPPTTPRTFYLHWDERLGDDGPDPEGRTSFTFDPRNPTPTVGGNGLVFSGSVDDTSLSKRTDVLTFDTFPLKHDLEFCGQVAVHLAHSTDVPFADIFVRVSEVNTKGKSHNICEAYQRLDPACDQNTEIKLLLSHHSHRFLQGTKIRLLIAGASFPQFARNQGVDNRDGNAVEMKSVRHTIHHNETRVSKVIFPIVET